MTDALTEAFAGVDRMRNNASKAIGPAGFPSFAGGSRGLGLQTSSLSKASEQYQHYAGWAFVAIQAIAQRIAGQDIFVAKGPATPRRGSKSLGERLEPLGQHELLQAIDRPNPVMVRWNLMFSTVASLKLTGRAFWWLTEGPNGLNIWPIPSSWMTPGDPMRGTWILRHGGTEHELPGEQVACFSLTDPSDPFGCMSPLQTQALAVSTDEKIQQAQHGAFKNGIHPGMAIKVGRLPGMQPGLPGDRPVLSAEQRAELVDTVQGLYGGTRNRDNPIIIDGMIEGIEHLTHKVSEMDFLDSGKSVKARIMQAFGVNPIIVGEMDGANRAQAVVANQAFCDNTCNPIVELMGQVLTAWVGNYFANDGESLVVWLAPCKADDREQKLAEWNAGMQARVVTPNEYRQQVLNLPAMDGGDVITDAMGNPIESRSASPVNRLGASRNGTTAS